MTVEAMRFGICVLAISVVVAVTGCAQGPETLRLAERNGPAGASAHTRKAVTPSSSSHVLAAIAVERVTGQPPDVDTGFDGALTR